MAQLLALRLGCSRCLLVLKEGPRRPLPIPQGFLKGPQEGRKECFSLNSTPKKDTLECEYTMPTAISRSSLKNVIHETWKRGMGVGQRARGEAEPQTAGLAGQ